MPNALASDIDYTLYFPNKNPSISLEDQQAIAHYQKAGYLFGLCSGRPYSGVINLFDTIHPDFYIISSGAIIITLYKTSFINIKIKHSLLFIPKKIFIKLKKNFQQIHVFSFIPLSKSKKSSMVYH